MTTARWKGPDVSGGRKPRRNQPERALQKAVCEALDLAGVRYFHCPSERKDAREAKMLSALGVKAGVPDLCFPYALNGLPRTAWIELKSETGSLTAAQKDWRDYLVSIGNEWACLRSVEAVVETLTFWRVPGASRIRL